MSKRGGHNPRGGGDQNFKYQQKTSNNQSMPGQGAGMQNEGQGQKQGGAKYVPKNQNYQSQGGGQGGAYGQNKQQYQQKGGQNNKNYQNYNKGRGRGGYNNYKAQGDQMMGNAPQFFPHQQNLQQMDQSEIQDLLFTTLSFYAKDVADKQGEGGEATVQNLLNTLKTKMGPGGQGNQGGYGRGRGGYQGGGRGRGGGNQNMMGQNMNFQGMPMPSSQGNPFAQISQLLGGAAAGMPAPNSGGGMFPNQQNQGPDLSTMPPPPGTSEESKQMDSPDLAQMQAQVAMQQQQALMNTNICEKHFPEPIIYMSEGKPLCKKCIQEQLQELNLKSSKKGSKDDKGSAQDTQQKMMMASMLGMTGNLFKTEKSLIGKCLLRMDDFKGEFRYLQDEIEERAQESNDNLENLPEQMCQIFDQSEKVITGSKQNFLHEIDSIINKQRDSFKKDNETKVPNFYERLSQKYSQLQQATSYADQIAKPQLIQILGDYQKIFLDLDAEFEKYFNEFENVSKLQRLLDKDQDEIIKDFQNLIEINLRVDYNIKNSFQPGVPSRVHSFQWNQKYAYIFKVHNSEFEKRSVQMEFEVPLYSRSIATNDGGVFLIGGCNKRRNQYLKNCYRYNEIFGSLDEKAQMIYPHADHSLCAIEGYIYVVGTFVNSQVYGFCEVYDIQKDQWKQIDSLRVARSGVALSSFKNNFIFAFGGRIDQKNIVDTIECYDISKNVWQEIVTTGQGTSGGTVDKSHWIPGYMSLAYQITDNEIMIFGGKSAITQQIFNGCFVFDVQKMEIQEKGKLVNPCSFMNTPLVFGGNMYAFGNDIYIHKYSIAEQKWSCIPKAFP